MEIQGVPLDIWCLISEYLDVVSDRTSFWHTCRTWRRAITKARRPKIIYKVSPDSFEWWGRLTHGKKGKRIEKLFVLYRDGTNFEHVRLYVKTKEWKMQSKFYACISPVQERISLPTSEGCYLEVTKEFVAEIQTAINKFSK